MTDQIETRAPADTGQSNLFSPSQLMENYVELGVTKAHSPAWRLLLLALMGGVFVAFGGVVSNTAVHSIGNAGIARLVSGLVWPIGLAIVMLLGGELFLGNTMMVVPLLEKRITIASLLRNWGLVLCGNLCGGLLVALMITASGQLRYNGGLLAVFTVQVAVNKTSMTFGQAVLMGVLCNLLVCAAVLCSLTAKDTPGRILGAYIPILYFITGGFDNAVANMYLIPAGLFARSVPEYAALVAEAGIDTSVLTWGGFFVRNLLPVTIGNTLAGVGLSCLMWACHRTRKGG